MPFIDSKITVKVTEEKKETIKNRLGRSIGILGKPESFLMVGIEDDYDLYFAGQKIDRGAAVSVQLLGQVNDSQSEKMTGEISTILGEELDIPSDKIYITYQGIRNWGWSGRNL